MNKLTIKKIALMINLVMLLLLISTAASFAYLAARIDKTGDTTITGSSGRMTISYDGGNIVTASNLFPNNEAFATKTFTVSGDNTSLGKLEYYIILVMDQNNFTYNAIKYTLSSENTDSNGVVATPITQMRKVGSDQQVIILGNASFDYTDQTVKTHTYNLKMYFPITEVPQTDDLKRTFSAHIEIKEGTADITNLISPFTDKLLYHYGGSLKIAKATPSLFSYSSSGSENKIYESEDDYGVSYFYRGAKVLLANNIIFAEHQWKIIRINGDGSVRIIYNGTCPNNTCTINSTGSSTEMGYIKYNVNQADAKYVGYMHGGLAGSPSTTREGAEANETSSTIKIFLDSWYVDNIFGTKYESYISDTLFCNDRQLESEVGGPATGPGYGSSRTQYAAYYRIARTKTPTLKCERKHDRFTVSDIVIGNGSLDYPIALITADEMLMAGIGPITEAPSNYLNTSKLFSTMSPHSQRSASSTYQWHLHDTGVTFGHNVIYPGSARGSFIFKTGNKNNWFWNY